MTGNENNGDFLDYFFSGLGHCLLLAKQIKTSETWSISIPRRRSGEAPTHWIWSSCFWWIQWQ